MRSLLKDLKTALAISKKCDGKTSNMKSKVFSPCEI